MCSTSKTLSLSFRFAFELLSTALHTDCAQCDTPLRSHVQVRVRYALAMLIVHDNVSVTGGIRLISCSLSIICFRENFVRKSQVDELPLELESIRAEESKHIVSNTIMIV